MTSKGFYTRGLLLFLIYIDFIHSSTSYNVNDANTLVTKLFDESSYNKLVQPDKLVNVNAGYNLISVNSLDIKSQIFSTTGFFILEWQDDRLKWNISAGGINYIYVPEDKVWHPDLIVLNLVNPLDKNLGAERPVKIESSGLLIWKQIAILSTFCSVNVLFFPFDRHICQLQLASLDLSVDDIQLEFSTEPVTTPLLQEGWQILTSTYSGLLTTSTSFDWNYMLTFNIEVQRYPGHYIMIIIFPTVLTALLSFVTFCLPLKSGVRIGYISTVVLALVFILTLFADTMPSSTRSPSILVILIMVTLGMAFLLVIITIFVMRLYTKSKHCVAPNWMYSLVRKSRRIKLKLTCRAGRINNLEQKSTIDDCRPTEGIDNEKNRTSFKPFSNKELAKFFDNFLFVAYTVLYVLVFVTLLVLAKVFLPSLN